MKVLVTTTINSAHRLTGTLVHGHTYKITAIAEAQKEPLTGIALAFADLQAALRTTVYHYDHDSLERTLSDLPATAENLAICTARTLSKVFQRIVNIRVQVGEDGIVETDIYQRNDGEYFSR